MPGWHEVTKQLEREGKVQVAGIVEEQHPDRTRLFMQWKGMDWPVMVDSLNLLEVSAVPITLFLDERGIIRAIRPKVDELETFIAEGSSLEENEGSHIDEFPNLAELKTRSETGSVAQLKDYAEGLFLWGGADSLGPAIQRFERLSEQLPGDGSVEFGLGVAYRRRFDEDSRDPQDFQKAVEHWSRALEINPNQYIWRRRIQQYGPRLDKPYAFYDWVAGARAEILARGEVPYPLTTEPAGAELAVPLKTLGEQISNTAEPDPGNRILQDRDGLIRVWPVVVPNTSDGARSARVHILFYPDVAKKAHWNNEAGQMQVWLAPADEVQTDKNLCILEVPPEEVSQETRRAEYEVRSASGVRKGTAIPGYALYYVCEDVSGTCLYRRLDFEVKF